MTSRSRHVHETTHVNFICFFLHIPDIDSSLVVEEDGVASACRVDANVKFLLLHMKTKKTFGTNMSLINTIIENL